ncbi:hypothetical protein B9T33_10480 [Acinetobacter sp. ANC 5054]|uniref:hypothetical protein n=1 Tax=Acinetobacter sp. ANC 5054 TaxID=1977877 RepID=UPI000A355675|nr:hypothetical protein [Acinetobacter sp. ANC 5054]OTG79938.1 hypothetical protein B9T33_10480 [Acinetobacter sp. ANC 5054]
MFKLIPALIRLLKLDRFKWRPLTSGEITMCQSVFGDLINYEQVKVMNHPFLPWQASNVVMAPSGYIHARNLLYKDDYAKESLGFRALFIHEMAHVYQYQKNINVLALGAVLQFAYFMSAKKYNPYRYQLQPNKGFFDYNIEQQGDIARDIYLKRIDNIILQTNASD